MRLTSGIWIAPAIMAVVAPAAMATVYMSPEQAVTAIFSGRSVSEFKGTSLRLSKDERKLLSANTGLTIRDNEYLIWTASDGSQVYVDKVIGKHEFITFAMGVTPDGKVCGVEILEYRETYGGEIRRPDWRKQFKGKQLGEPFKLGSDIMNLSGATLSSRSVTDGVKRLLALRDFTK